MMFARLARSAYGSLSAVSTIPKSSNLLAASQHSPRLVKITGLRSQSTNSNEYPVSDGLSVETKNQVLWIRFNRPNKYNAITRSMYEHLTSIFRQANKDSNIKALVLTGNGDYYSSGNDLNNLLSAYQHENGPRAGLTLSRDLLVEFVDSLIHLEKFTVAAINGPAIGIAVTTLPLFDHIVCSDTATFQTPFTSLGQCPEACSSVTFPLIMGYTRANEILQLNRKWDAKTAQRYGLVSDIIESSKFQQHLDDFFYSKHGFINTCYPKSLGVGKSLIRSPQLKEMFMETNRVESDALLNTWLSEESADAVQKFMKRSKK